MKFTESHEWIELKEGIATVGISDHAQHELGEIVYVELPKVGNEVKAGEEAAVLESTKAAADIYAPVSGKIQEVNTLLGENPGLVNESPEDAGWLFKMVVANPHELDFLLDPDAYRETLKGRK